MLTHPVRATIPAGIRAAIPVAILVSVLPPALLTAPSAAATANASANKTLTVTGTGTTSVDWRVSTPTRLDFSRVTMTTKGDVVAFAVESLAPHEIVAMSADAPKLEYNVASPVFGEYKNSKVGPERTVDDVRLAPGRYRLRLVSHGESRVVVPVTSGRGAILRTRDHASGVAVLDDPRVQGSAASLWSREFHFRGKAMGIFSTHEHTYVFGASAVDECVQQVGEGAQAPCRADPWFGSSTVFGAGAVGDGSCRSTLYLNSAWIPSGDYRAEVKTATAGVDKEVLVLFAVIEPSR